MARAIGMLPTAMGTAQGDYLAGMFSDDEDRVGRFYVNLADRFGTPDNAMAFARRSKVKEAYRAWDDGYECKIFQRKGKPEV